MGNISKVPNLINVDLVLMRSNDDGLNARVSCWTSSCRFSIGPFSTNISTRCFNLNFALHGASSPLESWAYATMAPSEAQIKEKLKHSYSGNSKISGKVSFSANTKPEAAINADIGDEEIEDQKTEIETELEYDIQRINFRGTLETPSWSFRKLPYERFLEGMLIKEDSLFKVYPTSVPSSVRVDVEFPPDSIVVSNNFSHGNTQNTRTNMAALYIRWLLRRKAHTIDNVEVRSTSI